MSRLDRGIVLVGFMGAGKTTVGRELAVHLGVNFLDLDEMLSEQSGRSIESIIKEDGETRFREIETETLAEALQLQRKGVIALGGGTWTLARNRGLLRRHDPVTIWLDTDFDICWDRIQTSARERPLAADKVQTHALFERRRQHYSEAELIFRCDGAEQPEAIARAVIEKLGTLAKRNGAD